MKSYVSVFILFIIGLSIPAQTAEEIIKKADSIFTGKRLYSKSNMVIYKGNDAQPLQEIESYSMSINGRDHSLSIYRKPDRLKGTAYLMIENDLWARFSSTKRIRKLTSSAKKNSAGGSDFSYADMGEGSKGLAEQYNCELLGDKTINGTKCYFLSFTPKQDSDSPYEKLEVYVSRDDFCYIRVDYYDSNVNIKSMYLTDYRVIDGLNYPFRIEMKSHVKDSRSVIETTQIEFNSEKVQARFFSQAYLESIK